jgi:hypothetical protein
VSVFEGVAVALAIAGGLYLVAYGLAWWFRMPGFDGEDVDE